MKVRWTNESVRVRITPGELAALIAARPLTEALHVPGGAWRISVVPTGAALAARAEGDHLIVELSPDDVRQLAEPGREGVYAHQAGVRVLVEKDFPCAHPHAAEAAEPDTERFAPTPTFIARKAAPSEAE